MQDLPPVVADDEPNIICRKSATTFVSGCLSVPIYSFTFSGSAALLVISVIFGILIDSVTFGSCDFAWLMISHFYGSDA